MSYEYSENTLVQDSAGHLLHDELGWEVAFAYNTEVLGVNGTFGRTSYREILLTRYFRAVLKKLNPWITYLGIVKALRKALADYTVNVDGGNRADPTVDKSELVARIYEVIGVANDYLVQHDFSLKALVEATDFKKLSLLQDAANAMCGTLEIKKTFQTYAVELNRLMKYEYADRDDVDQETRAYKDAIIAIYDELQKKRKHADNTDLMVQINGIVNEYILIERQGNSLVPSRQFDISRIDFDLLRREFAKAKKKNLVMKDLEDLIAMRLERMMAVNPGRINYYERYQEIINQYNAEQDRATIEKTFMDLMNLAFNLDSEQQRYVREGFASDEELSLYDLLFQDNLSKQDIKKLKELPV